MRGFSKSINFKNIIFWTLVVIVLYTSYEWLGDLIVSAFGEVAIRFDILSDSLLNSIDAFMDTFMSFVLLIIYLIAAIFIVKKEKASVKMNPIQIVLFCIIVGFGVNGISGLWFDFVDAALSNISFVSDNLDYFSGMYDSLESGAYIWSLLSISIVGPIVEEVLFRLLIFHALERIYKKPWFPIIVSGLLFGIWHMVFVQSVYTAITGCILGFIYYKTRNIFITIFIHMINNFIGNLPPALDTDTVNYMLGNVAYVMILPTIAVLILMFNKKSTDNFRIWEG